MSVAFVNCFKVVEPRI
uniref:Uncharacterized protein n=1 Tax=Anguilla anguilla TaxID=7936 RepID=A0A0E9XQ66_ANGAN